MRIVFLVLTGSIALAIAVTAQLGDSSFEQLDHPAIEYSTRPARDPVALLSARIQSGDLRLTFDEQHGYLRSLLNALDIPIESQVAVFSKTSTQFNLIHPGNPRAIYFNDQVSVGWMPGTFVLEIAAQDPVQGAIFYEIDQQSADKPLVRRTRACLRCHHSIYTNGVPGRLIRSTPTAADGTALAWTKNLATDHRTPYEQRWGGWYVTGKTAGLPHMGNAFATTPAAPPRPPPQIDTLAGMFDTTRYLTPFSDVVVLMVLEHQIHLLNLLTRLNWEMRAAAFERENAAARPGVLQRPPYSFDAAVSEIADYLLFVDEAPLPRQVQSGSGFAAVFEKRGPFDRQGRSLRQLDLERRLLRYPCSYLIYSPMFDELPASARDAIYRRMWRILSGADRSEKYSRMSERDRVSVIEILRETKQGLPEYFRR